MDVASGKRTRESSKAPAPGETKRGEEAEAGRRRDKSGGFQIRSSRRLISSEGCAALGYCRLVVMSSSSSVVEFAALPVSRIGRGRDREMGKKGRGWREKEKEKEKKKNRLTPAED